MGDAFRGNVARLRLLAGAPGNPLLAGATLVRRRNLPDGLQPGRERLPDHAAALQSWSSAALICEETAYVGGKTQMRIPDFKLERCFARWELVAKPVLCASDLESFTRIIQVLS